MATLNTVSLNKFVDLVDREFLATPELIEGNAKMMYISEDIPSGNGESKTWTEVDPENYAEAKNESAPAAKADVAEGYTKTVKMRRYAKEIDISWEMRNNNKYAEVGSKLTSLSHFVPKRMELNLTHRFTFAFSTSYTDMDGKTVDTTTGDGLSVISSSHTLTASSKTYSNQVPGNPAFSSGAFKAARKVANNNILTNLGERRTMNFNVVFTSDDPDTVDDVKQYLKSKSDPEQNNPGVINVSRTGWTHVELPNLATNADGTIDSSKRRYWGIAAINQGLERSLQARMAIWEQPRLKAPEEDVHTDDWTFGTRGAWASAIVSPKGVVMSKGDNS